MAAKTFQHRLEYVLFRTALAVVDALGPRLTRTLAVYVSRLIVLVLPAKWTRTDVARENLRRALGESTDRDGLDEAEITNVLLGMWQHTILVVYGLARAHRLREPHVNRIVRFQGDWALNEQLLLHSGRPVLELGGHLGDWELGSVLCGLSECPMGIVARRLDNPYLDRWFRRLRERTGHELLCKNRDFERIVERLERGGRIAMLCDQDAGRKGVFVPFLGRPASTFRSIALLAIRYRAIVCVGYSCRSGGFTATGWPRFEMGCEDVIDAAKYDDLDGVERLTARYTASLERIVRRFPEQYFWLHRRWKTAPPARRVVAGSPSVSGRAAG